MAKMLRDLCVDSGGAKYRPSKEELKSMRAHLRYWGVRLSGIQNVMIVETKDDTTEEKFKDALISGRFPGINPRINSFRLSFNIGSRPKSGTWMWDGV